MLKIVKIKIIKAVCRLLLPPDVWVGKHFGTYTQRYDIIFAGIDSSGVLQGITEKELKRRL